MAQKCTYKYIFEKYKPRGLFSEFYGNLIDLLTRNLTVRFKENASESILMRLFAVLFYVISNGNRTEWSPIRSVIIRVITKSDDRSAGVQFVYHEYDYRPNWTTRRPITN